KFLDNNKTTIKNCLIILDSATITITKNSSGNNYIKHPLVSGESRIYFQYEFLKTFLSNKFFVPFLALKLNIKLPKFLDYQDIVDKRIFVYDKINNDVISEESESEISKDINNNNICKKI